MKPGCRAGPDTCPAERAVREGQYLAAGDGVLPKAGHALQLLAHLFADGAFPLTAESGRSRARCRHLARSAGALAIRATSYWKLPALSACARPSRQRPAMATPAVPRPSRSQPSRSGLPTASKIRSGRRSSFSSGSHTKRVLLPRVRRRGAVRGD